ncbi:MAG TPA: coniferyl-alcohol dehydrogenase [Acidimicrobiia bacterium]|nr:coniferyl-alcohol dehydrogenase [Acidimicrobiia bacterium]
MDLTGRRVVVTGVASGIGLATAQYLKERGATIVGVDIEPSDVSDDHFEVDLSDPDQIDGLVEDITPGAHGLCNVAGVPPSGSPAVVLAVNAKGLERLTVGLAPGLSHGASIVNIASSAGNGWANRVEALRVFDGVPFEAEALERFATEHGLLDEGASYFFSKEFVVTWTMRNRWRWRDRGIRVNSVSPGPVDTPALQAFIETLGRAKRMMKLMDRPGLPEEIAPVVAFLLSDESAWIRGSNIAVDGGMTSHLALEHHGLA